MKVGIISSKIVSPSQATNVRPSIDKVNIYYIWSIGCHCYSGITSWGNKTSIAEGKEVATTITEEMEACKRGMENPLRL